MLITRGLQVLGVRGIQPMTTISKAAQDDSLIERSADRIRALFGHSDEATDAEVRQAIEQAEDDA